MVFCNTIRCKRMQNRRRVTILILIDGFLQWKHGLNELEAASCHNPYFNRWFSAIQEKKGEKTSYSCHNPYFNRWFSAMVKMELLVFKQEKSQSLF